MYLMPYLDGEERVSVSTKCTNCKSIQEHQAIRIIPMTDGPDTNPMDLLKLAKRLTICTNCGLLKTIN